MRNLEELAKKHFDKFLPAGNWRPAVMGLNDGTLEITNEPYTVWVVYLDGTPVKVLNQRVSNVFDKLVVVGYDPVFFPNRLQVLAPWDVYPQAQWAGTAPHAPEHGWLGDDPAWISKEQFLPALVIPVEGELEVDVFPNPYMGASAWVLPADAVTRFDFSDSVPADGARYSLFVQNSAGTLVLRDGTVAASRDDLVAADLPMPLAGDNVIAGFVLYDGMIELQKSDTQVDIIDLRFSNAINNQPSKLTVEELDGAPTIPQVVKIIFPNGSITDSGSGIATIVFPDAGITELTGDVTAGPGIGSQVATIASNAVDNTKLAEMPSLTLKGNNGLYSADPQDLTVAEVIAMGIGGGITELTGEVTSGPGSGSQAATIADGVIDNANFVVMPTMTVKGNDTGGNAVPKDLTLPELSSMGIGVKATTSLGANLVVFTDVDGLLDASYGLRFDDNLNAITLGDDVSPKSTLHNNIQIVSQDSDAAMIGWVYSDNTIYTNTWFGIRVRGTTTNPAAVAAEDVLMRLAAGGWDGDTELADILSSGRFQFVANENFDATSHGTRFEVWTTEDGSTTRRLVFTIGADGNANLLAGKTYNVDGSPHSHDAASGITALTGDVTATGPGSAVATIANSAVTNAKLANMAQSTIKGRAAGAGTGAPVDLTSAQVRAIDGTADITLDPTGFSDPSAVVVTYSAAAQTITLTGTWVAYWRGQVVTALTAGWVSDPHPNVTGHIYRLYYDGSAYTWLDNTQWPSFSGMMIASVNYGATDKYGVRECHGLMNWQAHEILHETIGTFRETGGILGSWVANSTTAGNRRPTVTACTIHDEDIITVNAALTSDQYTQMFIPAGATAKTDCTLAAAEIVPVLADNPYYNQFTSGLWKQTLMSNNAYMCVWLAEMPVTADAGSQAYRHAWVQGQTNGNLASQTALTPSDLNLGTLAADASEFVFIAKVIIRYTDDNWVINSVTNLTGNKFVQVGSPAGAYLSTVAVDATLTGDGTLASPLSAVSLTKLVPPVSNILTLTNAAASTLAINVASGKTLTLTAADSYALTVANTASVSGTNTGDNAGVTSVTGTSPVSSTGGTTPAISMPAATNASAGYATAAQITSLEASAAKVSFPGFGTTAALACVGNDARLSDPRTPTAHNQAWSTITSGVPTTLAGYGITDVVAYRADKLSVFAATTSAELAGIISNETGTGVLVFGTAPTLTTSLTIAPTASVSTITTNSADARLDFVSDRPTATDVIFQFRRGGDAVALVNILDNGQLVVTTGGLKVTGNLGFFGTTPVAQAAAYTQTYATAARTVPNATASNPPAGGTGATAGAYDTAANRNLMITSLTNCIADVLALKKVVNGLIDDLQSYGLVQ